MRRRIAAAMLTVATLGIPVSAFAASLPKFPPRTPYAEARRSLLALGYSPVALPDADEWSRSQCGFKRGNVDGKPARAGDGDERCYPEMEACAGTGLGQCVFAWRRGDTLIEVLTTNELPLVSGVRCRVNC